MAAESLLGVIQTIIQEDMQGSKLTDLCFGTVAKASPLTISIEGSALIIPEVALTLTDAVVARSVNITDSNGDTATVPLSTALQVGDRVVMLRCAKGQRFIVLSRVQ